MLGPGIYWLPAHGSIQYIIDTMKLFLIISACVAATLAEAPAGPGYPESSGPYPPSGWKPSGRLLALPSRQQAYGAPAPQPPAEYGPPQEYGPPATEATPEAEPTESTPAEPEDAPQGDSERIVDSGVYYVLQADGKLQMVQYSTAPLNQKQSFQQQKFQANRFGDASNFDSQRVQPEKFQQQKQAQLSQVQAHQAQFQYKPAPVNQQPAQYNQQPAQYNQQPAQYNQQQTQFSQQSSQYNQQSQSAQYNQQPSQYNPEPTPFHYIQVQKSVEVPVVQPDAEQSNGGFVANVQYRDVEPISAPIYAYNPAPLIRILKK